MGCPDRLADFPLRLSDHAACTVSLHRGAHRVQRGHFSFRGEGVLARRYRENLPGTIQLDQNETQKEDGLTGRVSDRVKLSCRAAATDQI